MMSNCDKPVVWILNHYAGDTFFDKGGRHYSIAKYLKLLGYKPIIFCSNAMHGKEQAFFDNDNLWHEHISEDIDVPYVYIKSRTYTGNGKQRLLNMLDFYKNVKKTVKQYAAEYGRPDVIYASSVHPLTLVAGIQIAHEYKVKCICEVRDLWPESIVEYSNRFSKNNIVIKALYLGEKWIYRKADALVFTMENAYQYIQDKGWSKSISREKVHYINNGVDFETFDDNRLNYKISDLDLDDSDRFNVVYVGSIRHVNNVGSLLDVAKLVKNPKVRFLIWGDGDEKLKLETRMQDEHIGNVVFKGRVNKQYIPYISSKASINIMHNSPSPLFKYGISMNKLFDYLAAGRPILVDFESGESPISNNIEGRVCSETPEDIAATIDEMSNMSDIRLNEMSLQARRKAEQYSYKKLVDNLSTIIKNI